MNFLIQALAVMMGAAVLAVVPATPGEAMPPVNPTYTILTATEIPTDYSKNVLVESEPIPMVAGKSYAMTGRWDGTSDIGSLQGLIFRCFSEDASAKYSAWATTNHLGVENGNAGENSIYNRWLFTPTITGDYQCELLAQAGRTGIPDEHMTATNAAFTIYTAPKDGGKEWRMTAGDRLVNKNARTTWALKKDWTAPPGTTSVRLWSGPEVSCYSTGNHNPFVGEITTYANQVDKDGNVVKSWSKTTEQEIPGKLHHFKFDQSLTLDPDTTKPLRFRFSVRLRWVPKTGITDPYDRHGGILHGKSSSALYSALHAYPLA